MVPKNWPMPVIQQEYLSSVNFEPLSAKRGSFLNINYSALANQINVCLQLMIYNLPYFCFGIYEHKAAEN